MTMTDSTRILDSTTRPGELVDRLSLAEKVHLLTGETAFTLPGNGRIGLAPLAAHESIYTVLGGVSDGLFGWPPRAGSSRP